MLYPSNTKKMFGIKYDYVLGNMTEMKHL